MNNILRIISVHCSYGFFYSIKFIPRYCSGNGYRFSEDPRTELQTNQTKCPRTDILTTINLNWDSPVNVYVISWDHRINNYMCTAIQPTLHRVWISKIV